MSLMEKLADAANPTTVQTPKRKPLLDENDNGGKDKGNVKALFNDDNGTLDFGEGNDRFVFNVMKNAKFDGTTGNVDMGTGGRDVIKLVKNLDAYEITDNTDDTFTIKDIATEVEITFSNVDIIKTKSETFNLKKMSIAEVIDQSGNVDWDGKNRATLDDVDATETLDMGAGRDVFHFNNLNKTGSGRVDLGAEDGAVDRVKLKGSIDDYTITNNGTNIFNVTHDNGSSVDFVGMGAEDLFVFANVEKSAGTTTNYENDVFTRNEMAAAHEAVTEARAGVADVNEDNADIDALISQFPTNTGTYTDGLNQATVDILSTLKQEYAEHHEAVSGLNISSDYDLA